MQVILLEKVVNLGNLGDVVKVKDGYARNYLIPQRIARRATEEAVKEFETKRAELEAAAAAKLAAAQEQGEKLDLLTNYDIAEALTKQGFEIHKSQVRMPQGPFKAVGDYPVSIALHTDVIVDVTVSVLGEHA